MTARCHSGRRVSEMRLLKPLVSFDITMLEQTLALARAASLRQEVPVGAIVVSAAHVLLGQSANATVARRDVCAHAELLALSIARETSAQSRLDGATLYVSLEPCLMCLSTALTYRVRRVVFAARSPKYGALSAGGGAWLDAVPHAMNVECAEDDDSEQGRSVAVSSAALLKDFFARRRAAPLLTPSS